MLKPMNQVKRERRALKGTPCRHILRTEQTDDRTYHELHATKGWRVKSVRKSLMLAVIHAGILRNPAYAGPGAGEFKA